MVQLGHGNKAKSMDILGEGAVPETREPAGAQLPAGARVFAQPTCACTASALRMPTGWQLRS